MAIFDEYAASVSLVLIALFELLAISYIYGLRRFCDECELMTGSRPSFLILLSWRYLSPLLLLVVMLATLRQFSTELSYEIWAPTRAASAWDTNVTSKTPDDFRGSFLVESWPSWCIVFGAALVVCCVIWIPVAAIVRVLFKVELIPGEKDNEAAAAAAEDDEYEARNEAHLFPAEELREYHSLHEDAEQRKASRWERILFGFTDDD